MYPQPVTNDPDRVAPDHRIHLPDPTPVRPRRPMAAVVLSVLLGLSCFAASPTWAYKAGVGAADRPWNVNNIKNYKTLEIYRTTSRSDRIKDTQVTIGNSRWVYRVTDLEERITANTLSENNLPDPVDHLDRLYDTVAVGADAYTETRGAIAIGSSSSAIGNSAIAIGNDSGTQGRGAVAIGRSARAPSQFSVAIGQGSRAQSRYATAIGHGSRAQGESSTALGDRSHAQGLRSTALGDSSHAQGGTSVAVGSESRATSEASTAIGYSSWATGLYGSTAIGRTSRATGERSTALGGYASASGSLSTAVGQTSQAHGDDTVAVGRGAVAGGLSSDVTYPDVAAYLKDTAAPGSYVQIGEKVYQVTALERQRRSSAGLTKDNLPDPSTATAGGVAVGVKAEAKAVNSIALGRYAEATGTNGIAIGSTSTLSPRVSAGANEVVIGASGHTYKLPGLGTGVTSGTTRVVTVDSNGQLSIQSTTAGTASSRGAGALSSDVTALNRNFGTPTEAADYEEAPAIGSGPNAPATAEQRRVVVQDTNRDGSVRLRTLDLGDLSGLDRRVTSLGERLNKATAMSSALSALPNVVPGDNRFFLGVGVGHYSSEQALAVGMSARIESRVFVNAGVAVASGDDVSVRGGVGVVW